MDNIIHLRLFSYRLFSISAETLLLFLLGFVTNALSVVFKRLYIKSRNDEYDKIGSSLPALVTTWDHLLVDSLNTQNVVKYSTR